MTRLFEKRTNMKIPTLMMLALSVSAIPAWADGDAALGEQIFKKCAVCHSIADKANRVGPSLLGVVGRKVATAEGYNYSDSMKAFAATGAVWDEKTLNTYLVDPKATVAQTKMAFPGLKEQADRDNVIAFLKSKM
jgi:cytochrome c